MRSQALAKNRNENGSSPRKTNTRLTMCIRSKLPNYLIALSLFMLARFSWAPAPDFSHSHARCQASFCRCWLYEIELPVFLANGICQHGGVAGKKRNPQGPRNEEEWVAFHGDSISSTRYGNCQANPSRGSVLIWKQYKVSSSGFAENNPQEDYHRDKSDK